jgi:spermidine synthase
MENPAAIAPQPSPLPNGRGGARAGTRSAFGLAVVGLGASALVTQVTLMRELVSVLAGNELVFGIVLGTWLLLMGIGATLGRIVARLRCPLEIFLAAQVLVAVLPMADVWLLRWLRNVVFVRGAAVGVTETAIVCLVLLAPYCLLMGSLLTLATAIFPSRREGEAIGGVYFLDSLGGVAGGLAFSFLLVGRLDHFWILALAALANLILGACLAWAFGRRAIAGSAGLLAAVLLGVVGRWDLDALSAQFLYPGQTIVHRASSPYGSLVVTGSGREYNFLENGVVLFSTQNLDQVEEEVHYAMAQRPDARQVLLLGGGISGTAREVLKYPAAVDYVELDPAILDLGRRFVPESLADERIEVFNTDGRLMVRHTQRQYDVVLVNLPDPTTWQLNRFYSEEFLAEVKRRLSPDGVLAVSAGHYENRLSPELAALVAVMDRTLRTEFARVLILPADRVRFLASDGPLTEDVATPMEERGIPTRLLNRRYLRATLAEDRLADVRRAVTDEAPINRDFSPILTFHLLRYWASQFDTKFRLFETALAVLLVVCVVRFRPVSFAVFTTGWAGSTLEVVLLMGFQVLYGSVYHRVGLIMTMFMLGLAIGSMAMNRVLARRQPRDLARLQWAIALYALGLPLVLTGLSRLQSIPLASMVPQVAVYLLALALAVLVGMEFPLAGKADFRTVAATTSRLYTADYLGAALGALVVSALLIPLFGVTAVCLVTAGLNLASGAVVLWSPVGRT